MILVLFKIVPYSLIICVLIYAHYIIIKMKILACKSAQNIIILLIVFHSIELNTRDIIIK